jgi:LSD1 subclass zinc finger protein
VSCKNCGGTLKFAPGTTSIVCPYCNTANEIHAPNIAYQAEEIDYLAFLEKGMQQEQKQEISVVKCPGCGAESTLKPNITSDNCAFCGTSLVVSSGSTATILKPKSLLPFRVTQKEGIELFNNWLGSLWFAPNDVSQSRPAERLKGMYIPYWTFDSYTYTDYQGERGDDYIVSETYTDSEGNTQTRSVTRTRWYGVSGMVEDDFDDVLVPATTSLPKELITELEPWDLEDIKPYDDQYLSGFQTETYHVKLKEGFEIGKEIMKDKIDGHIRQHIGGDHQRINHTDTKFTNITFKHILLPIWICSYRYNDKIFRFLVNGRTGEVQGERPYSWIKITLAVLLALAVVFAVFYFTRR